MSKKNKFSGIRTYVPGGNENNAKKGFLPQYMKIHEIVDYLDTDTEAGISSQTAKKRIKTNGLNLLYPEFERNFKTAFIDHLKAVVSVLLAFSLFVFYLFYRDSEYLLSAIIISLSIIVDCIIEHFSSMNMINVRKQATIKASVKRNNDNLSINSRHLVPGDIVVLRKGTIVPADIRLFDSNGFVVLETPITGSDVPVKKIAIDLSSEDDKGLTPVNMAFAGSIVTEGRAKGIVCFTGTKTKFSSIPKNRHNNVPSLFRYVFSASSMLSIVSSFMGVLMLVFGIFFSSSLSKTFLLSLTVMFCSMCDSLVSFSLLSFSNGVKEMQNNGAILRNLSALENIAFTNSLLVHQNTVFPIIKTEIDSVCLGIDEAVGTEYEKLIIKYYLLCSRYDKKSDEKTTAYEGKQSVVAAAYYADSLGISFQKKSDELLITEEKIGENDEYGSVLAYENGQKYLFIKGTPDEVLPLCKYHETFRGRKTFSKNDLDNYDYFVSRNTNESGFLVAIAKCETDIDNLSEFNGSSTLTLCGFIKFKTYFGIDYFKDVSECKEAGIDVCMFSSEPYMKAYNLGKNSGIFSKNNEVITEEEINYMSSEEFDNFLSSYKLFLNFPPQMFNKVVSDKKTSGKIVAISAESTNDLVAMKNSNVSFVIKSENSEMIKQASDVVLNSGGFDKINNVFSAAKKIYRRIHSICEYNVYNYISIFLIFFFGLIFDLQFRGYDFLVASVFISGIISLYLSTVSMPKKHKYTIPKKRKKSVDFSEYSLSAILGIECSVCSSLLCIVFNGDSTPAIFLICYSTFSILAAITILNDGIPFYKHFIGINFKALLTLIGIAIIIFVLMFFPPFVRIFSYGGVSLNALVASLILPLFFYVFNLFALKRFNL